MFVRVCRECGEEYRPEILRCADCGGDLETRYEDETTAFAPRRVEAAPEADPRPPGDYQPIVWRNDAAELTSLADRLMEGGIPFYLRPREGEGGEHRSGYEIRVRQEERALALEEMAALAKEAAGAILAVERDFDPESGYRRCPACAAELPPRAVECRGCGLAVGDSDNEPGSSSS